MRVRNSILAGYISLIIGSIMLFSGNAVLINIAGWAILVLTVPLIIIALVTATVPKWRRAVAIRTGAILVPEEGRYDFSPERVDERLKEYEYRFKYLCFWASLTLEMAWVMLLWYFSNTYIIMQVALYGQIGLFLAGEIRAAVIYSTLKANKVAWGAASLIIGIRGSFKDITGVENTSKDG